MTHPPLFKFKHSMAALGLAALMPMPALAIDLLTGLGGTSGFGQLAMSPNDDGSSNQLDLPFELNFFGTTFGKFFINNNGNITFNTPLFNFTPNPFPVTNQPMIAPWWADVDTRGVSGAGLDNAVYVASPNSTTTVVTWSNVGYFPAQTDKRNDFQLVLRNRAETGAGNFDIDFRYNKLEWTTGSASGGVSGLGGVPAQAGYDNGQGTNFLTLPGSLSGDVLDLVNTSNVSASTPGLWTFAVRNGETPGGSASNPLMPVVTEAGYDFAFNVQLGQRIFIDPEVAVGYDYVLTSDGSPSFQSVVLPNAGDGIFDLFLMSGGAWIDSGIDLLAGVAYDFGAGGVRQFSIRGIETSAGLDPLNRSAFVTGLTFDGTGDVTMLQTPLTVTVAVPEPGTYAMLLLGLAGLGAWARRRQPA